MEQWTQPGKPDIQEVSISDSQGDPPSYSQGDPPIGTFTLSFDGYVTDSLSVNISEKGLKDALQFLPSISSVEVIRRDERYKYVWRVTFRTHAVRTLGKLLLVEPSTDFFAGSSNSLKPILPSWLQCSMLIIPTPVSPSKAKAVKAFQGFSYCHVTAIASGIFLQT